MERNYKALLGVFAFLACVFLAYQAFFLVTEGLKSVDDSNYKQTIENSIFYDEVIAPRRGTIYDRNGTVLAIDVEKFTITCDPDMVDKPAEAAALLVEYLGGKKNDYLKKLTAPDTRYSLVVDDADSEKVKKLRERMSELQKQDSDEGLLGTEVDSAKKHRIEGLFFKSKWERDYPSGNVAGQVIGLCGEKKADDGTSTVEGISGLELQYNDVLSGKEGRYRAALSNGTGYEIPGSKQIDEPAVDGKDIIVSIDIELQRAVEASLAAGVENVEGKGGSSVVMDGATGEIYAAASLPLFDPTNRKKIESGATQLKAVSDLFEPGSVFKTVTMMSAFENTDLKPTDTIFCPSYLEADGYVVSDAHERGDETMTVRSILDRSSNVGVSMIAEKAGFTKLYNSIVAYKFHELTGVDYPGEQLGYLVDIDKWSRVMGYNVSFGQGLSVTPIQVVRFYGAIVNDGVACTPHFLVSIPGEDEPEYKTEKIINNEKALKYVDSMLQTVVSEGTGTAAAIDGLKAAGKTSTAEIYDETNGGYQKGVYNLAFCGYLSHSTSDLVCFVSATEVPGDRTVTPVFHDIMTAAVERFNITSE